MSLPELVLWAVVLAVGIPSAWRNPTAGALVLCWVVSQTIYALTGNGLAVEYYAYPDIFVIAVIFAKREYCNLRPYRSTFHQLACVVLERSPADRFILLSYPVVWYFYTATSTPHLQYWALYLLSVAQFLAAGAESLSKSIRCPAEEKVPRDEGDLLFAFPRGAWLG
jgi:hypothetical protein